MVTAVPFPTSVDKVAASQFESRMQPWLPARPMVSGTGLPWMPMAGAAQSCPEDADGVVGAGGKVVEVIGALPATASQLATTKPSPS